jgi:hypothetical protein
MAGKGDSGRSDVASNVKAQLTEILEKKFGLPPMPAAAGVAIQPPRKLRGGE